MPAGRGTLVVRFTISPGDSVLRDIGSPRLEQERVRAHSWLALRRDSTSGAWIADNAPAGLYSLEPRALGWSSDSVTVVVRAGFADTAVVPLERYRPCLNADRTDHRLPTAVARRPPAHANGPKPMSTPG